jgi:hypothetical protein
MCATAAWIFGPQLFHEQQFATTEWHKANLGAAYSLIRILFNAFWSNVKIKPGND